MARDGDPNASWHNTKQAFDTADETLEQDAEARAWLIEQGKKYGLYALDEYENPYAHATGGHIHFSDHGEALSGEIAPAMESSAPQQEQQQEQETEETPIPKVGLSNEEAADVLGLSDLEVREKAQEKLQNETIAEKNQDLYDEITAALASNDQKRLRDFLGAKKTSQPQRKTAKTNI